MKKTITIIVLMLTAMSFSTSCFKDLDIEQASKITSSNMWQDENDCLGAMYGMYDQFRSTMSTAMIYWGEYRSGTFTNGIGTGTADKMFNNQLDVTEAKGTTWATLYTLINDANLIIRHTPDVSFSNEETKNLILGNAYFIRAYSYFIIARVWGDAPLLLTGFESSDNDLQPSRTDASEIYAQVLSDIESAISTIPSSASDCTIASVAAAQMLKVDYLLWMYETRNGDKSLLEDANSTIDKVLANSNYSLLDSYENVFSLKNKNNKEIIFTIHFAQGEAEGGFETVYLIPATKFYSAEANIETHVKIMTSDDQRYNFSPKLIALLKEDPADTRTAVSFGDWTDTSIGMQYTWVNKFSGLWQDKTRYFIADKPIYRYAEALMFKAEIEMLQGNTAESLKYLNKVAKRAYGKDDYYSISSSSELRQTLMNEYLKEFAAEAKSWWCYIRLGYAFTEIESLRGRQNETNILLWPINSACMNENPNIRQTVGY